MRDEVKSCVDAKVNFFDMYFSVPESIQSEVNDFIRDTNTLGDRCSNAAEFEAKFISTGLSDRFNAILPKCKPKAAKMTREQKRKSMETAKEILTENRKELAEYAVKDTLNRIINDATDEQIQRSREQMIEDGTMAEHTIRKNRVENAGRFLRFLGDKFK